MSKKFGWFGTFLIVGFGLILLLFLLVAVYLSGGVGGLISNIMPEPNPARLRDESRSRMDALSNEILKIQKSSALLYFDEARHDYCYAGMNDFKVRSDYAHRCDVRLTRYYGFNGDFREQAGKFEKQVIKLGWSTDSSLDQIMALHYDRYLDTTEPRLVSDLPTRTFYKGDLFLEIEYAQRETQSLFGLDYAQAVKRASLFEIFEKKDGVDTKALFAKIIKDHQFVVGMSIQARYFDN